MLQVAKLLDRGSAPPAGLPGSLSGYCYRCSSQTKLCSQTPKSQILGVELGCK
ncbi:hypothetical protein HMPREF3198_01342 [Winkia neuii]|nr:hypothetical protein HMPREF3198_01342 [Winkia neuii]